MRYVAYFRVSTERQGRSGLGLDAQRKAVADYVVSTGGRFLAGFTEVESGKRDDRPQLALALAECRMTGATLVIAKLDRLSRDAAFLINLQNGAVEFVAVDMPNANRITVGIMALVAQQEREAISVRTKMALEMAKAHGRTLGGFRGHRVDNALGTAARSAHADRFALSLGDIIKEGAGRGVSELARTFEARGILTPSGGHTWTPTAASRVAQRYWKLTRDELWMHRMAAG